MRAQIRGLLRQRGYVALAVATLTLAVGANLVVFTIVNALWLRPRPVTDPDRVVWVTGDAGSLGSSESYHFAPLGLERLLESGAFEAVAGQTSTSGSGGSTGFCAMAENCREMATPATTPSPTRPEFFNFLPMFHLSN